MCAKPVIKTTHLDRDTEKSASQFDIIKTCKFNYDRPEIRIELSLNVLVMGCGMQAAVEAGRQHRVCNIGRSA